MKNFVLLTVFTVIVFSLTAQQTSRTFEWDGVQREYIEFIPNSYSEDVPSPVIFCLHGLGDNMNNFSSLGFNNLPSPWIVITPQALMANIPFIGDAGESWNAGVGATVPMLGTIILNESVDDDGFLMAILDSLENNFNINTDSVFFMGFSLGACMAQKMAVLHGDRINGIASVSGTYGDYINADPAHTLSMIHFHGTNDQTISYQGVLALEGMGEFPIGLGADEIVELWRDFNNCDLEPTNTLFPNTMDDGLSFERYLYENGDDDTR
ncbi:MAG: hypothetical protein GX879_09055, partial [Bacteroidales bacterium]|nr:hypothetical protein [Bacteroidales bacterium]